MKTQKTFLLIFMALAVFALSTSCSDDDNDSNVTDNENNSGQLSFTVDGEEKSFDASALHIITVDNEPNSTAINLDNAGETTLQIIFRGSPGDLVSYDVSNESDENGFIIISIGYKSPNETFTYFNEGDNASGQFDVTEYTESLLSGNFNATLVNANDQTITLDDGSFTDLIVSENTD